MKLEDLRLGTRLHGVTAGVVTVVQAETQGDAAVSLTYKDDAGGLHEVLLFRDDESRLELASPAPTRSFTADPKQFLLAAEAERIRLAHLFDPYLAVHTSKIEPLPRQQVFERLSRERTHWDNRANELRARERGGKHGRIAAASITKHL